MGVFGNIQMPFKKTGADLTGVFDIIVDSRDVAYTFVTGGASGVTWLAEWSGGSTTTTGDNPIFDLSTSVGDVNITAENCILSSLSFYNTFKVNLLVVNTIDISLCIGLGTTFRSTTNLTIFSNIIYSESFVQLVATFRDSGITVNPFDDMSQMTTIQNAFFNSKITEVTATDYSSATTIYATWFWCYDLVTFPVCDFSACNDFRNAWYQCNIDQQGVENILLSLVNSGKTSEATAIGKINTDSLTAQAQIYYDILVNDRGWTITLN